jgi:hypothetical protein
VGGGHGEGSNLTLPGIVCNCMFFRSADSMPTSSNDPVTEHYFIIILNEIVLEMKAPIQTHIVRSTAITKSMITNDSYSVHVTTSCTDSNIPHFDLERNIFVSEKLLKSYSITGIHKLMYLLQFCYL